MFSRLPLVVVTSDVAVAVAGGTLPVEEKVISWTWCAACDGLYPEEKAITGTWRALAIPFPPLPVEEKAIMGTWRELVMPFSPCLSRKRQSW